MKVKIEMETLQTVDGSTEVLRHAAAGLRRERQDGCTIINFSLDSIHNELQIDRIRNTVTVTRNHAQQEQIRYEKGLHHQVDYQTPAGAMKLGFKTERVEISEERGTGILHILLLYGMTQFDTPVADCELRITVSPFG